MLIITLLLFVVGQQYKVEPEEYGVAINFGDAAPSGGSTQPNKTEITDELPQENIESEEEIIEEESVDNEVVEEEVIEEEVVKEEIIEEETSEDEIADEEAEAEENEKRELEEAEKVAKEEAAEAERLKTEAEAKAKAEKEAKEATAKAEAKAKAEAAAKKAKAIADAKSKAEAKAKAAAKAKAEGIAKAKAAKEAANAAKAKADAAAKAAAAKKASEQKAFTLSENSPIYPGCESATTNDARKKCMSQKVAQFIGENFKTDVTDNLTGVQKISIVFKISASGDIVNINARAEDPLLVAEAKRVIKLLPEIKPAMQQGKAVIAPFSIPVQIKLKE